MFIYFVLIYSVISIKSLKYHFIKFIFAQNNVRERHKRYFCFSDLWVEKLGHTRQMIMKLEDKVLYTSWLFYLLFTNDHNSLSKHWPFQLSSKQASFLRKSNFLKFKNPDIWIHTYYLFIENWIFWLWHLSSEFASLFVKQGYLHLPCPHHGIAVSSNVKSLSNLLKSTSDVMLLLAQQSVHKEVCLLVMFAWQWCCLWILKRCAGWGGWKWWC